MHDEILRAIGSAVPLLLLAWYANRIRQGAWRSPDTRPCRRTLRSRSISLHPPAFPALNVPASARSTAVTARARRAAPMPPSSPPFPGRATPTGDSPTARAPTRLRSGCPTAPGSPAPPSARAPARRSPASGLRRTGCAGCSSGGYGVPGCRRSSPRTVFG